MTNANRNNKEQLVATLSLLISELEEKIKEYLNSFDMNSAFSFSNNEETTLTLKDLIEKIDNIKPEQDLYSVLVEEQLLTTEV